MATTNETTRTGRYVPVSHNTGWGVIALVIALAIVVNAWSFWVHKNSYRNPIHPSSQEPNTHAAEH